MKKIFSFIVFLALLVSCSQSPNRYILIRGFSYSEGMEDENWRIKVLYGSHGFDEVVIDKEVNELVLTGGSFIGKINLATN